MNQQCKVCGEPAAGFHFGAFTCEGCKSFFGRTYNNLGSISECKNNGLCVINKKNRTACKACRLRKCLMVGMSKSGSRYGRRSNWFKIHCLLQEQSNNSQTCTVGTTAIAAAQTLSSSNFGTHFLPGFIPELHMQKQNIISGKDNHQQLRALSHSPPTFQEDLALQSHLLNIAMMKQQQQQQKQKQQNQKSIQLQMKQQDLHEFISRSEKSPQPGDIFHKQLKLFAFTKDEKEKAQVEEREREEEEKEEGDEEEGECFVHQHVNMSSLDNCNPPTTSRSLYSYKDLFSNSTMYAVNFAAAAAVAAAGPKDSQIVNTVPICSFKTKKPYMPSNKQCELISPSNSEASSTSGSGDEQEEPRNVTMCNYNLETGITKLNKDDNNGDSLKEQIAQFQEAPQPKINATVTLATDYELYYPPLDMISSATAQYTLRGSNLLLDSPSPGSLAIEQMEPIDLSVKSRKEWHESIRMINSGKNNSSSKMNVGSSDNTDVSIGNKLGSQLENATKSNPLDLSLDVKRPAAEVLLS